MKREGIEFHKAVENAEVGGRAPAILARAETQTCDKKWTSARFEVLTAVLIKIQVLWDITPC
jgi:hypothetical protein